MWELLAMVAYLLLGRECRLVRPEALADSQQLRSAVESLHTTIP